MTSEILLNFAGDYEEHLLSKLEQQVKATSGVAAMDSLQRVRGTIHDDLLTNLDEGYFGGWKLRGSDLLEASKTGRLMRPALPGERGDQEVKLSESDAAAYRKAKAEGGDALDQLVMEDITLKSRAERQAMGVAQSVENGIGARKIMDVQQLVERYKQEMGAVRMTAKGAVTGEDDLQRRGTQENLEEAIETPKLQTAEDATNQAAKGLVVSGDSVPRIEAAKPLPLEPHAIKQAKSTVVDAKVNSPGAMPPLKDQGHVGKGPVHLANQEPEGIRTEGQAKNQPDVPIADGWPTQATSVRQDQLRAFTKENAGLSTIVLYNGAAKPIDPDLTTGAGFKDYAKKITDARTVDISKPGWEQEYAKHVKQLGGSVRRVIIADHAGPGFQRFGDKLLEPRGHDMMVIASGMKQNGELVLSSCYSAWGPDGKELLYKLQYGAAHDKQITVVGYTNNIFHGSQGLNLPGREIISTFDRGVYVRIPNLPILPKPRNH